MNLLQTLPSTCLQLLCPYTTVGVCLLLLCCTPHLIHQYEAESSIHATNAVSNSSSVLPDVSMELHHPSNGRSG